MSLKSFHILFILLSILLALGFGFWSLQQGEGYLPFGIGSLLATITLLVYGINFLKKMKNV